MTLLVESPVSIAFIRVTIPSILSCNPFKYPPEGGGSEIKQCF